MSCSSFPPCNPKARPPATQLCCISQMSFARARSSPNVTERRSEHRQSAVFLGAGSAPPTPAPAPVPVPAPSPSKSLGPVSCGLEALVNAGNYNTLIELVEAASNSTAFARMPTLPFPLLCACLRFGLGSHLC